MSTKKAGEDKPKRPTKVEIRHAAMAWAEYLYAEYRREKADKLIKGRGHGTTKGLTNHDKPSNK